MDTRLVFRPLGAADAAAIVGFLSRQPPDYVRFFYAFGADEPAVARMLEAAVSDVYSGIFLGDDLICVFMLRGWDAGFEIPSFGLVVGADRQGREVLTVALEAAKLITRLAGADRMMCKVHPDNSAATRGALKNGFVPDREEDGTGNIIYYLPL